MLSALKTRRFEVVLFDMDSFGGLVDFLREYRAAEAEELAKSDRGGAYQIIIGATEYATACESQGKGSVDVKSLVGHRQSYLLNAYFRKPHTKGKYPILWMYIHLLLSRVDMITDMLRVCLQSQRMSAEFPRPFALETGVLKPSIKQKKRRGRI
jgi:hypothetical protein